MEETKYGSCIIADGINGNHDPLGIRLYGLHGGKFENAPYLECGWFLPSGEKNRVVVHESHIHDFTEVVAFFGTDMDNANDLGGEIEFWLGDERHILTRSCLVVIPGGVAHNPLVLRKVERPIFHFSTGPDTGYKGLIEK